MLDIFKSGGWLMLPILFCSIAVIAICIERIWTLSPRRIAPRTLLGDVWGWLKNNQVNADKLKELRDSSPLGRIFASGLSNSRHGREVMKDSIEETASQVVHELEHYLGALGTIAAVAPLIGLLGTVLGMIQVFNAIMLEGTGNAGVLAGGISQALITTAAGLACAIPALMAHRYFQRRVDTIVVAMEQEAVKLVDALHSDRKIEDAA
ncbi:MotA/TolQ/ExbB proton channel family protein [Microbulbifer sp. OS29]|uniref:MotA/TolQ/ExbB proton channel family protein n=1 Tax=Microbulbifer okhotskensis TaxID=2926617 RepID=A0A9X2EUC5_9GAMM|nr:MotA/TolQ/ExbB proton channel family protein [Microbulbifer okhotskensis]MCO1335718.1 MotA/TolQ/ExbB proton channel family protein [Microbulbifer okhotskensis]